MKTHNYYNILFAALIIAISIYACQKSSLESASKGQSSQSEIRTSEIYYGDYTQIEIVRYLGGSITAYRTSTGSTHYDPIVVNLTNESIINGALTFDNHGSYFFIPFDMNAPARSLAGSGVTCVSKDCTGDCTLEASSGGCLRCQCSLSGDCDMSVGGTYASGIIIETSSLTLTNL